MLGGIYQDTWGDSLGWKGFPDGLTQAVVLFGAQAAAVHARPGCGLGALRAACSHMTPGRYASPVLHQLKRGERVPRGRD